VNLRLKNVLPAPEFPVVSSQTTSPAVVQGGVATRAVATPAVLSAATSTVNKTKTRNPILFGPGSAIGSMSERIVGLLIQPNVNT
jgi:hypothetical protein